MYLRTSTTLRVNMTEIVCAEKLLVYLCTSLDFTGQYDRKCGAADKSEALAPTYPQFVRGTQTYIVLAKEV